MSTDIRKLAEVDKVIHEPARLMIVSILYTAAEADFLYLLNETGLTKGNLSSHLSRLEKAGYIEIEKTYQGKVPLTICKLNQDGRTAFERYYEKMNQYLKGVDINPS